MLFEVSIRPLCEGCSHSRAGIASTTRMTNIEAPEQFGCEMTKDIQTSGSKLVYENRWMPVREHTIVRPDGSKGIYGVVEKAEMCPKVTDGCRDS